MEVKKTGSLTHNVLFISFYYVIGLRNSLTPENRGPLFTYDDELKRHVRLQAISHFSLVSIKEAVLFMWAALSLRRCAWAPLSFGAWSSLWWLLVLWSTGSRHTAFSSRSTWAQAFGCMGLVAPWPVGSSQNRSWTGDSRCKVDP